MQKQEEQQFNQILEDNKTSIYRICRIYAVSPIEPQDLFQEVIFHIWKSYSTFKGKSNISTWIYKIALNVCNRSNMQFESLNNKTKRLESIQFKLSETIPNEIEEIKFKALRECISLLNSVDGSIIILHLDELPYKEIAAITDLTENHIAVKMKRIKNILLECITPKLK
ncbi:RNA polymerase sigma factor [Psychroflexus sp. MES1-P1E]|jgi:RNA polymerase sigma factor (sigma-70 family)|uniref:RNA polymerase sigma factor n=1 Tax=Psychroflexus sp. MES1-P1E TaxID=2058320 RepID=UPI000C79BD56|nr:sigma-70 family RNA polymerase sigma factor [Psychroflexus sp. MES1-P1E]PKG43858.1 RNA polymerase [Psychroflexus sp. MES1-P1E]